MVLGKWLTIIAFSYNDQYPLIRNFNEASRRDLSPLWVFIILLVKVFTEVVIRAFTYNLFSAFCLASTSEGMTNRMHVLNMQNVAASCKPFQASG